VCVRLSDVARARWPSAKPARARRRVRRPHGGRRREADEFYAALIPPSLSADAASVMRQALAGMLWSSSFYYYDVEKWLEERGSSPFHPQKPAPRNDRWHHMYNADVISMPDKWEYPWYAAWIWRFTFSR